MRRTPRILRLREFKYFPALPDELWDQIFRYLPVKVLNDLRHSDVKGSVKRSSACVWQVIDIDISDLQPRPVTATSGPLRPAPIAYLGHALARSANLPLTIHLHGPGSLDRSSQLRLFAFLEGHLARIHTLSAVNARETVIRFVHDLMTECALPELRTLVVKGHFIHAQSHYSTKTWNICPNLRRLVWPRCLIPTFDPVSLHLRNTFPRLECLDYTRSVGGIPTASIVQSLVTLTALTLDMESASLVLQEREWHGNIAQVIGSSRIEHLTFLEDSVTFFCLHFQSVQDRTMRVTSVHDDMWMDGWNGLGSIFPRVGPCATTPYEATQGSVEALDLDVVSVSVQDGNVIYSHRAPLVTWWRGHDMWFPSVTITSMTISEALLWRVLGIRSWLTLTALETLIIVASSTVQLFQAVRDEATQGWDGIPSTHVKPVKLSEHWPYKFRSTLELLFSDSLEPTLFTSYGLRWVALLPQAFPNIVNLAFRGTDLPVRPHSYLVQLSSVAIRAQRSLFVSAVIIQDRPENVPYEVVGELPPVFK